MSRYNSEMLSALKNADNFVVCTHIYPDGDAIGSLLSMGRLLGKMGKRVTLCSQDGVPKTMTWLPDAETVCRPGDVHEEVFDIAIAVDVPETTRMGESADVFGRGRKTMVIDHHATNKRFGQMNVVDADAAATGEMLVDLWNALDMKMDSETAMQLYTALETDTGNFSFNCVRAETFDCMRQLMDAGLDIAEGARKLSLTKSRAHIAALGKAISSMEYFAGGRATCMHLSLKDKAECNASDEDLHDIVNSGLYMEGVRMTFMADETPKGWKYSLRCLPGDNVSDIALSFGGGGHQLAAGVTIPGDYETSANDMKEKMEKALQK